MYFLKHHVLPCINDEPGFPLFVLMYLLQSLCKDSWNNVHCPIYDKTDVRLILKCFYDIFKLTANFYGFLLIIIHAGAIKIRPLETIEMNISPKVFLFMTGVGVLSNPGADPGISRRGGI